jgi:hypothetical protein
VGEREYLAERGLWARAADLPGHALIMGNASLAHLPATRLSIDHDVVRPQDWRQDISQEARAVDRAVRRHKAR